MDSIENPVEYESIQTVCKNQIKEDARAYAPVKWKTMIKAPNLKDMSSLFIENAPDVMFLCDDQGFFLDLNEQAEKIAGYKKDELIINFAILSSKIFNTNN